MNFSTKSMPLIQKTCPAYFFKVRPFFHLNTGALKTLSCLTENCLLILVFLSFFSGCTTLGSGTKDITNPVANIKQTSVSPENNNISQNRFDDARSCGLQKTENKKQVIKENLVDQKSNSSNTLDKKNEEQPEEIIKSENNNVVIKTDQELLDSALEFCQASNEYWDQGDLENALDALDQAYKLVLEVKPNEGNADIIQQRDDLRFTIAKRIIEIYSSRFIVANGNHKAIPLTMNSHVKNALDLLKGKERHFFLTAYRRSGKYRPFIVKQLKAAGLPEELSWLPLIESGFKVRALSKARALGMWQFIASTGYKFGLKRDLWVDERMDVEKSTEAAIAYLKELHQIFGDWSTVLAAYNCGEGRVLRQISSQKINYLDNFWDLYEKLPSETACYVPKFLAVLHILNDPEAHGFKLPPVDDETVTDSISIDKQAHLKTIATNIDVDYEALRNLNPALRNNLTPPGRPYELKVPAGKGEELFAKLDQIPVWIPPVTSYGTHTVKKGETLLSIAMRYKTTVKGIMALNRLKSASHIREGWNLKIPSMKMYSEAESAVLADASNTAKKQVKTYKVKKGDSLWLIARRFDTTANAIITRNNLKSTNLQIGQPLLIPGGLPALAGMQPILYTVQKGDYPAKIAANNQMELSELLKLNKLTPSSKIFPGQSLLVKAN